MANNFVSFALDYYKSHPGADQDEMLSAWNDLEFQQQLNDAQKIDVGKVWDSINSQKGWMGGAGNMSWGSLSGEDQAALSSIISQNPDILFQDVAGRSFLLPEKITTRSVGDSTSRVATPFDQRAAAYFGNYFAPTQADMLYRLAPEIANKYGINEGTINALRQYQSQSGGARDSAEWSGMNREAALMAAIVLSAGAAGGAFGAEAGAGAGAGEAGGSAWGSLGDIAAGSGGAGSAAGYTGTASELAADGLGGVDMGAGSTAYYDAGAGMWVDSSTGAGISSGAEVPAGYTAESGSTAIAASDAAPSAANSPSLFDNIKDYYQKGSNAKSLVSALQSFTNSPQISSGGGGGFDPMGDMPISQSGGVSGGNAQSVMLENPVTQIESAPAQQQPMQSGPLGMIDVSPANNTFLQAGSTWNQQMANALRNRNAY